ncbi:MAG: DMT family transporter, partial [Alphaproteobacteria bacterium]
LREPVRRPTWFAMVVAFAGVAVMVAGSLVAADAVGTGFAIACAMAFSLFVVALRAGRGADMMPVVTVAGGLVMLVGLGASGGDVAVPWRDIGLCVVMGSFQVTLGLIMFIAGARYLPAAQVTLLSELEIVLGPLWVFLAYGETPSRATAAGGVLVLAAVVGQSFAGRTRVARPPVARPPVA